MAEGSLETLIRGQPGAGAATALRRIAWLYFILSILVAAILLFAHTPGRENGFLLPWAIIVGTVVQGAFVLLPSLCLAAITESVIAQRVMAFSPGATEEVAG